MYMRLKRKMFSKDREQNDKSAKLSAALGAGGYIGGVAMNQGFGNSLKKRMHDGLISDDEKKIFEQLKKGGEGKGVLVWESMSPESNYYVPSKKTVVVGTEHPEFIAHELGHAHYDSKEGGAIGKAAHKAYMATRSAQGMAQGGMAAAIIGGGLSGYNTVKAREKGKKENKIARHSTWVAPLLVATPALVSEGLASRKGIKLLKESGASKEIIKNARKGLAKAWGTYAAVPIMNAGIGEATRAATIGIMEHGKSKYDDKKKK